MVSESNEKCDSGVFRNLRNINDGVFFGKNSQRYDLLNVFAKKLVKTVFGSKI